MVCHTIEAFPVRSLGSWPGSPPGTKVPRGNSYSTRAGGKTRIEIHNLRAQSQCLGLGNRMVRIGYLVLVQLPGKARKPVEFPDRGKGSVFSYS